jgi:hypothetical protein
MNAKELESNLQGFNNGTNDYHRSSMLTKAIFHTDGIEYLAKNAKAYWLIDAIVSYQTKPRIAREQFQVWTLQTDTEKHIASLLCTDGDKGDGPKELARQVITYTDFPLPFITLYLENGSLDGEHIHKILMLPSER